MTENKNGLRGEQLGQLYAQPKTYEERQAGKRKLEDIRLARRPKNPRLNMTAWGGVVFVVAVFLIGNIGKFWATGSLSAVSFTFLGWLLVIYLTATWVKYVSEVFYAYEQSSIRFWVVSRVLMLILFAAAVYGWLGLDTGLVSVALFGAVYFVVTYSWLRVILKVA